jgi:hypothetical protein
MADFRKWFLALSATAIFAATASAQTGPAFTCTSNAGVPPLVRSQGITELVGDVILNCTGGTPTALGLTVPQNNVQIFLNTNVTSRLLAGSSSLTEALLMIDEPLAAQQRVCTPGPCGITGAPSATGAGINYATAANIPNVYQGSLAAANSISWLGVPIDPPGSTGVRIVRITNIRANANQLGVSSTLIPTQIVMFISVTGNSQVAINNPQQTVAYIQNGLTFSVFAGTTASATGVPVGLQQCISNNVGQSTDNTSTSFGQGRTLTLSYKENFASAFKVRVATSTNLPTGTVLNQNTPGQLYNNESGFYSSSWTSATGFTGSTNVVSNLTGAGLADSGTKLIARFNNVPAGIVLYVTVNQVSSTTGSTAQLISTDVNGANGSLPNSVVAATTTSDTGMAPVTLNNGSGSAVWEIATANPLAIDELRFGVSAAYTANPAANLPGLGASTVNGTFAPLSTVTTASSGPIPRFADTSTATATFTVTACTTNILFPFLTNQAGFDSGVSIANTSADPFGTAAQAGPCTLNYYGGTTGGGAAPAAQKSGVVNSGTLLLFTLSGGGNLGVAATPGFQGYMIAQCNFQYAHGFAFISDVGANKVSEAYLGLILDPGGLARTTNVTENLTH